VPRSRAWQSFLVSRAELRQLMNAAEFQSDQLQPGRRLSDQENFLRLVVVALVGQFQAYIADLMDELCDHLPNKWEELEPFQKRYVTVQLRRRLESVLAQHSEDDLAQERKLEHFKNALSACSDWPQKPATLASASSREEVYGFLKDNSSKSLNRAISQFRPDGMQFSDWLYKRHVAYRETFDVLDNAIRLRNEAAHGQVAQRLTLRDARTYRAIIYRLVQKADEYLEERREPAEAPTLLTEAVAAPGEAAIGPNGPADAP
jgi:hypothetical protein